MVAGGGDGVHRLLRPSEAMTRNSQPAPASGVLLTSGSATTHRFRPPSPNDLVTARQSCTRHTPLLPQLTLITEDSMRDLSSSLAGVWSEVRAAAAPWRLMTARQSPRLAT
uniref:Uncharacterized protein n=1 Tax=Oryza meridionalis TaxID=40149 RepID=A0A0E0F437_9ORYZ